MKWEDEEEFNAGTNYNSVGQGSGGAEHQQRVVKPLG